MEEKITKVHVRKASMTWRLQPPPPPGRGGKLSPVRGRTWQLDRQWEGSFPVGWTHTHARTVQETPDCLIEASGDFWKNKFNPVPIVASVPMVVTRNHAKLCWKSVQANWIRVLSLTCQHLSPLIFYKRKKLQCSVQVPLTGIQLS